MGVWSLRCSVAVQNFTITYPKLNSIFIYINIEVFFSISLINFLTATLQRATAIIKIQQTMTSLEIAELTGKRHNHLMRDIRNMELAWEKVTQSKFGRSTYKDPTGRTLPCYSLTKTECLYMVHQLRTTLRVARPT